MVWPLCQLASKPRAVPGGLSGEGDDSYQFLTLVLERQVTTSAYVVTMKAYFSFHHKPPLIHLY